MQLTTSWQAVATQAVTSGQMTVRFYLDARYDDTKNSIANNESYIYTRLRSVLEYGYGSGTGYSFSCSYCTSISGSEIWYFANETILESSKTTIGHNTDGTKSLTLTATAYNKYLGINVTLSGNVTLDTIPRYATSNQSLNSKTETTIKMNWSSDNTIDYLWYSTNNGSNWTGVDVADGTSGTYTISGLTANTAYTIKTRVRRKDSQLTTDSSALSVTTYKAPTNSLNSRTETTIKMNWSIDSTADYIWYSKDNGSTWTAVGSVSATSGSYTISGLSANTTYKIKTRVRRKATQTTYDCSVVSVTTYNYPYITAVGTTNLTIGNSQKLTLYNPLSRTVTIKMYQTSTSGTQLYSGTTSSTTITFTPTASTLYASIPSAKSGKCVYSAIYSSSTKTTSGAYTYVINEANCKPTFTNFTYADVDSTVVTGNNQILVNNNSDCKFTISTANKAVAKNSATIVSYKFEHGSNSTTANYSSNSEVTAIVYGATGGTLKVTAIDSRGLSTTVTKTVPYIAYTSAVVNIVEIQRLNGVDLETYLGLKMTIWKGNWQNGSNTAYDNQLKYVGYRVYDGSAWTSYFDITSAVKTNVSSYTSGSSTVITLPLSKKLAIHANGSSSGFTIGKEYKIQILIKDGTSTATFTPYSYQATAQGTVPDGKVGFSRYKDSNGNYHYAINGMPESDTAQTIYGDLRVLQGKYDEPKVSVSNGDYELDFLIGGSGTNRGIYDRTLGKWMCYINSDKKAIFLGNADTATTATKALKLGTYLGLTSGSGSTAGWKLVVTKTFGTWQQGRWVFSVASRHNGNGILAVSLDTNGTINSYAYNIRYIGSSTGLQSTAWRAFYNTSTGVFRLYYYYNDYSPCKLTPLIDGTTEPIDGTWYTTLPTDNGSELTVQYNYIDKAGTATTATNATVTNTNPTSLTDYYPTWITGAGNSVALRANNGCIYQTIEGTTSANGRGLLALGNSKATGTAGNKFGALRLYSKLAGYVNLQYTDSSSSYTIFLPAEEGFVQLKPTTLYNNTSGTTGTVTLSSSAANFTYIEVFYVDSSQNEYASTRIYSPNGKRITLSVPRNEYNQAFYNVGKTMSISGTSMAIASTAQSVKEYGYFGYESSTCKMGTVDYLKIVRVVGYK